MFCYDDGFGPFQMELLCNLFTSMAHEYDIDFVFCQNVAESHNVKCCKCKFGDTLWRPFASGLQTELHTPLISRQIAIATPGGARPRFGELFGVDFLAIAPARR